MISKRIILLIGLATTMTSIVSSCQSLVYEDRRPCPGNLFFLLDKTLSNDTASERGVHMYAVSDNGRTDSAVSTFSMSPDGVILNVGFGHIDMYAYAGIENMDKKEDFYCVRQDMSADSVYTYHRSLDLYDGTFKEYVKFTKQFMTLTVKMPNVPDIYSLWLKGTYNGIDICSLDLLSDGFESQLKKTGIETYSCRMLRQQDTPFVIEVRNAKELVQTIKVSEMMQTVNYDWSKQNLDDCLIILNRFGKFISGSVLGYIDSDFIFE